MKKNHPLSVYNSDNPPNQPNQESSAQNKSPYLKAIFSGSAKQFSPGNNSPVTNSDHAAALRYIKESALVKKIYVGKISC
jgi:hypothetical protein